MLIHIELKGYVLKISWEIKYKYAYVIIMYLCVLRLIPLYLFDNNIN